MMFNYIYGKQADQYSFIRIPKLLVTEHVFNEISIHSKLLYGLLLDRMGIAVKNEWIDESNRMFVIYPVTEIKKDMGVTRRKAIQCLSELEEAGLIEQKMIGMGIPNALYVKDFAIA